MKARDIRQRLESPRKYDDLMPCESAIKKTGQPTRCLESNADPTTQW